MPVTGICLVSLSTCVIRLSGTGVPRCRLETKEPGSKLGLFEREALLPLLWVSFEGESTPNRTGSEDFMVN